MADMVNRIFAAGLSFASAEPLIRSKAAVHRLRAGIDELDDIIRALQLARLALASQDRELGRHLEVAPHSVG